MRDVRNRRWGVAPSIAFGLGSSDTLTLAYLHQQEDNIPDVGVPFLATGLPPVPPAPRDAFYGLISNRATADDDIATARYRHAFSDDISLADTLRYANYDFGNLFDAPNFGANPPVRGEPLSNIFVGRDAPSSIGAQTDIDEQLDLTAHFDTGAIAHTLATGLEMARQGSLIQRYNNPFNSNNGWITPTPLLDPNPYEVSPVEPITSNVDTIAPSGGAYVIDTIGLGSFVQLTGGYRYDYFSADYKSLSLTSHVLTHLTELNRLASPRAALMVTPTPHQTYYFSYGTSFDPSAEALTLTAKTAGLGPVKAHTLEVGAKTGWLDDALTATAALFRTEVDNAQTNDPDNPTITVLNGDQRVDGLELDASGHLTARWEINAGYTYLDGRTIESGTAAYVGKDMPNVAHDALNLWTEYYLSNAWEIGAGGQLAWQALRGQRADCAGAELCGLECHGLGARAAESEPAAQRLQPLQPSLLRWAVLHQCLGESRDSGPGSQSRAQRAYGVLMLVRIASLLDAAQLAGIRARLAEASWEDGRSTAGPQSAGVKRNLQLPSGSGAAREVGEIVLRSLEGNAHFLSSALPRHVFPPLFNRYEGGMGFGTHIDNAVRQVPGTHHRLRTDVSATLFLSEAGDYDGGELVVEDTFGEHTVKLDAGDLVLYPASSLHRVTPVTRGSRMAAFFWIQSMVRDDGQRRLLYEMDTAIRQLTDSAAPPACVLQLTGCYHNLLRRWAEM